MRHAFHISSFERRAAISPSPACVTAIFRRAQPGVSREQARDGRVLQQSRAVQHTGPARAVVACGTCLRSGSLLRSVASPSLFPSADSDSACSLSLALSLSRARRLVSSRRSTKYCAAADVTVSINAEKPRKGAFVVTAGGQKIVELLNVSQQNFTPEHTSGAPVLFLES